MHMYIIHDAREYSENHPECQHSVSARWMLNDEQHSKCHCDQCGLYCLAS